jgi:hypothetical protein
MHWNKHALFLQWNGVDKSGSVGNDMLTIRCTGEQRITNDADNRDVQQLRKDCIMNEHKIKGISLQSLNLFYI